MKTKSLLALMLFALLSLLTGCARLPQVTAKSLRYESSYPVGGTTITMTDVEVTPTEVKAATYTRKSRWWWINQDIQIEGYSRKRESASVSPAPGTATLP